MVSISLSSYSTLLRLVIVVPCQKCRRNYWAPEPREIYCHSLRSVS